MKRTAFFILLAAIHPFAPSAKETRKAAPTGWVRVLHATEVLRGPTSHKQPVARPARGALALAFESKDIGGTRWMRVRVVDPATLEAATGWLRATDIETLPLDRFPLDADLLKELGGTYLEDIVAAKVQIARYLARQGERDPALVCFIGSLGLPSSRLQVFESSQGKFILGPFLEYPFSEIKSAIADLEVQDLVGDGNECLITHEPFELGPEKRGVKLVIKRIERGNFANLWEAPLEYRNLAAFPPQTKKAEPAINYVGADGTVTKATVEFRPREHGSDLVWKAKVEFFVPGREEPVDSLTAERVCTWDGRKFTPIK